MARRITWNMGRWLRSGERSGSHRALRPALTSDSGKLRNHCQEAEGHSSTYRDEC
jgi:hypothetical protein